MGRPLETLNGDSVLYLIYYPLFIYSTLMKSVSEILSQRATCRRYERQKLTAEQRDAIFAAIRNTPTSFNAQNYTVIYVDDQELKEQLYEIIGQKQIKTCAAFFLFCTDFHKIEVGARAKGLEMPRVYDCLDGIVDGTINASLALMSGLVVAESLGLGTCPIGYARTVNPSAIAALLKLPEHTMVICGLAIGVPAEHNDLKPKQPTNLIIQHNGYSQEGLVNELLEYDKQVSAYNATRSGETSSNDWISHIVDYYREMNSLEMLEKISTLGFSVER